MNIAIINDIHMGIRRGSEIFLQSQLKFFRNQFIPELIKRKIDTIIIPGDFFDNRIALDNKILTHILDLFDNEFKNFQIHILVGNHDSYLESSIHINSLRVFEFYKNIKIYEKNESITLGNRKIFMCPWITDNKVFLEELETLENHDVCFGHFNFSNFLMHKDQESDHGLSPELFYKKFKKTISGHFHTRSSKKVGESEIIYPGNPFHLTRNDIGDERGYSILNLDTLDLEFIENRESIKFVKYYYPQQLEEKDIRNNHVDIYVKIDQSLNEQEVDAYFERLEKFEPAFPLNKKTINMLNGDAPVEMTATSGRELIEQYVLQQAIENKQDILELLFELHDDCKNAF
jgi:DNA repair exonuclease SbcCD nuclease subunit